MPRPNRLTPAPHAARHLPTELLRRYVAGELSGPEEHAVEAHTLGCEQCAEVLEGLEMQPAAVTDASLTELRQRLHTRVAELADEASTGPAVIPMWWRPLAAAAVLLLTLGAAAWLMLRPVNRPEIAARSAPAASKVRPTNYPEANNPAASLDGAGTSATAETAVAAPSSSDLSGAVAVAPRRQPVQPGYPAPLLRSGSRGEGAQPMSAEVAAAEVAEPSVTSSAAAEVAVDAPTKSAASVTAKPAAPAADYASNSPRPAEPGETARTLRATTSAKVAAPAVPDAAKPGRTVQGRITDTAGQPVPGATVLVPGANVGVSTGSDGRFALTVPPGSRQLAVSSIGYTTQFRFLQAADSTLTLALAPDRKQLSEVVVVRREAPPGMPSVGPLPAGGYPAFRQYLRDSLNYPEKARDQHLQGTVRLQFVVEADGQLSGIKAVRRLSPECDEEAIRLLKEGPAWFPGVQNSRRTARRVEINVPFSLEVK
ncbi:TonB family protein [Hymenobacter aerophilus]|uniref:TonB family protein n=1 Tax=Hymenobacter aerophilus TaxID=119644 RepID=UPI00037F043F|nr:TonB family protein [Hymenobacter aerophilus]